MARANDDIREAAKTANIKLWQIGERLGMNDGNLSRKLRRELSPEAKSEIRSIITQLKEAE